MRTRSPERTADCRSVGQRLPTAYSPVHTSVNAKKVKNQRFTAIHSSHRVALALIAGFIQFFR